MSSKKVLRKAVIKGFIEQGKHWSTVRTVYRVAWLMEERGYTEKLAIRHIGLDSTKLNRHTMRLYHLRIGLIKKQQEQSSSNTQHGGNEWMK